MADCTTTAETSSRRSPQGAAEDVDSGLTLEVSNEFHCSQVAHLWDAAVEELGGPIYMTWDWLETWWSFYGKRGGLRLFVFRANGKIVGTVPVYLEDFGFGPVRTRVGRIVGANIPPKAFDPPIAKEHAKQSMCLLLGRLLNVDRCDLVSFGPVSDRWNGSTAMRELYEADKTELGRSNYVPAGLQTVFELPERYEDYVKAMSPTVRKSRMKRARKLERMFDVSCDVVSQSEEIQKEFESFLELHGAQWRAVGKGGHFEAWPQGAEFHRSLIRKLGLKHRVRFFRMLGAGEVLVSRYTFVLGRRLFSELPARVVGEPWDRLGVGGTSLIKFNEAAISGRIAEIDSGLGDYGHKTELGGEEIKVGIWRIRASRPSSRVKASLFLLVGRMIKLVYHKVYYRRIVPRLPQRFSRTQSLFWLRFEA